MGDRWNGSAWVDAPDAPQRWDGSAWVAAGAGQRWNGSAWVPLAGGVPDPTATFWNSADAGTVGAYITAADTGSGNPWSTVTANQVRYASGGRGGSVCAEHTGSTTGLLQWNNPTPATAVAVGLWVKPGAVATADTRVVDLRQTSSAGTVGGLLTVSGRFRIMQASSGLSTGQSPVLPAGEWYWVSLGWDCTAKTARMTVHDTDGVSLHDSGSVALTTTYADLTTARFVHPSSGDIGTSQFDDFQFNVGSAVPLSPWGV